MIFRETPFIGLYLIELEHIEDERGYFARTFCSEEFSMRGLNPDIIQCNLSYNRKRGTIRGMHYQLSPHEEAKLVRCIRGAVYDVVIDLRPASATYGEWYAIELNEQNRKMLYIPEGFAHGFQSLQDDTEVFYQMSRSYAAEAASGIRWNDPSFQITWPLPCTVISIKDQNYSDYAL
ncbi:dTDP-4-dehydrorhamnose 3,5-epimerase [Paenibacillus guangzhouensis]|uniref:dTDP-4-dehydrorhamnose 3,5-epimerase n=1 Tax=Paenibacillus guangzhouensis TaxID=1473112 RepID=UPI0012674DAD|nr:dTDP-4-dehydrorhamnose 3,5-epimerase [Paenibacillus guangzhouensis]